MIYMALYKIINITIHANYGFLTLFNIYCTYIKVLYNIIYGFNQNLIGKNVHIFKCLLDTKIYF